MIIKNKRKREYERDATKFDEDDQLIDNESENVIQKRSFTGRSSDSNNSLIKYNQSESKDYEIFVNDIIRVNAGVFADYLGYVYSIDDSTTLSVMLLVKWSESLLSITYEELQELLLNQVVKLSIELVSKLNPNEHDYQLSLVLKDTVLNFGKSDHTLTESVKDSDSEDELNETSRVDNRMLIKTATPIQTVISSNLQEYIGQVVLIKSDYYTNHFAFVYELNTVQRFNTFILAKYPSELTDELQQINLSHINQHMDPNQFTLATGHHFDINRNDFIMKKSIQKPQNLQIITSDSPETYEISQKLQIIYKIHIKNPNQVARYRLGTNRPSENVVDTIVISNQDDNTTTYIPLELSDYIGHVVLIKDSHYASHFAWVYKIHSKNKSRLETFILAKYPSALTDELLHLEPNNSTLSEHDNMSSLSNDDYDFDVYRPDFIMKMSIQKPSNLQIITSESAEEYIISQKLANIFRNKVRPVQLRRNRLKATRNSLSSNAGSTAPMSGDDEVADNIEYTSNIGQIALIRKGVYGNHLCGIQRVHGTGDYFVYVLAKYPSTLTNDLLNNPLIEIEDDSTVIITESAKIISNELSNTPYFDVMRPDFLMKRSTQNVGNVDVIRVNLLDNKVIDNDLYIVSRKLLTIFRSIKNRFGLMTKKAKMSSYVSDVEDENIILNSELDLTVYTALAIDKVVLIRSGIFANHFAIAHKQQRNDKFDAFILTRYPSTLTDEILQKFLPFTISKSSSTDSSDYSDEMRREVERDYLNSFDFLRSDYIVKRSTQNLRNLRVITADMVNEIVISKILLKIFKRTKNPYGLTRKKLVENTTSSANENENYSILEEKDIYINQVVFMQSGRYANYFGLVLRNLKRSRYSMYLLVKLSSPLIDEIAQIFFTNNIIVNDKDIEENFMKSFDILKSNFIMKEVIENKKNLLLINNITNDETTMKKFKLCDILTKVCHNYIKTPLDINNLKSSYQLSDHDQIDGHNNEDDDDDESEDYEEEVDLLEDSLISSLENQN